VSRPVGALGGLVGLSIVLAVGAAGCSGDTVIDATKVQDAIVQQAADGGLALTAVDCPEDRRAAEGDTFSCTATLDSGEVITVDATQTDDDGSLTLEQVEAVIDGAPFAAAESRVISRDYGTAVTVTCPSRIVVDDGDSFECQGTDERGHTRTVTFTAVVADEGEFTYLVDGLPPPSSTTTT
jgi:hypothetical protein